MQLSVMVSVTRGNTSYQCWYCNSQLVWHVLQVTVSISTRRGTDSAISSVICLFTWSKRARLVENFAHVSKGSHPIIGVSDYRQDFPDSQNLPIIEYCLYSRYFNPERSGLKLINLIRQVGHSVTTLYTTLEHSWVSSWHDWIALISWNKSLHHTGNVITIYTILTWSYYW